MEIVETRIGEKDEDYILLGGDYNVRTGEEGGPINEIEDKNKTRISKDKIINKEGRWLIDKIEEKGWAIMNGSKGKVGGWTYIGGNGSSVIDYAIVNEKAIEEIDMVGEGDRTESDHLPLEVTLKGGEGMEYRRESDDREVIELEKTDWTEVGIQHYHKECQGWNCTAEEIGDRWAEIKEKVKNATKKEKIRISRWKLGKRVWHDREWKERKRKLRKQLRKYNKGNITKEEYTQARKEYKIWCEEKKRVHEEEEEKEMGNIRSEGEVWKYINKFRKRREGIDEGIEMEVWKKHFVKLLGGRENKAEWNLEVVEVTEEQEEKEEVQEWGAEDLRKQIKRLKKKKAAGEDGIDNETWMYMPYEVGEAMLELIKKLWREGGIPEDWRKGVICPIFKKGEKSEVKNYRGVTLMDTAYKMYAGILNEKLQGEVDGKLKEGQFGFRVGRGVADAVYVLNYIISRELRKRKGKVFAFFVDLKAAFDMVDRRILNERMKEIGVSNRLRERIMETYKGTKNVVRIGNKCTDEFWTEFGVRQGCPMSPTLFNVYIADLEDEMRRGQSGGMVVGSEKVWTITYADDIVLIADSEGELKEMMRRLKKYVERKNLVLSPEKSKVMVFEKGRGRAKLREWGWGNERIEEVREIRYLGYILQRNGGMEKHIKERMKRSMVAMKNTWSIGERLFKHDFRRRVWMFYILVGSIALFGAEIWGWQKEGRLDGILRTYVKWILGLDRITPNHILIEECKLGELRLLAWERAVRYEKKARNSNKKLVTECIREIDREKTKEKEGTWERKRREALESVGESKESIKRYRQERETEGEDNILIEKMWEIETSIRRNRIHESRYNIFYKGILTEGIPNYLKGKRCNKERSLIARFRCGNETRAGQHWREEEYRMCRICRKGEESIKHLTEECEELNMKEELETLLKEDGQGIVAMKRIKDMRELREKEEREKEVQSQFEKERDN